MGVLSRVPLHPFLLAAYAVLFVYAANISEALPGQAIGPLLVAVAAAAVAVAICALPFRNLRRGAVVATAAVLAFGYFGHVSSQLGQAVPEELQLALWVGLIVVAFVYAALAKGSLPNVTATLNAFGIVLVLLALATILPAESSRAVRATEGEPVSDDIVAEATRWPDRDIYFLVFDRYGSDWSLEERYGIDNDIYPQLEAAGFQVVPGARTNYRATDFSLSTMLNMELLDDLTTTAGRASSDRTPARQRIGRHEVGRFLRANGYRYYHIGAWYEPTHDSPIADEVLRYGKTPEFEAVVREATVLPTLERLMVPTIVDDPFRIRHRNEALFAFRQLERLADMPDRKFVFAHILMPHPPYVLDAEGDPVVKATVLETPEADLVAGQLQYTNRRMMEVVSELLDRPPDEQPIIVITGDEGPFLCGDVDCIDGTPETYGIRFGTLRAYYLPGLDYEVPADDTGVNIFRMLLREYFGADLPDLRNRSYDWPDNDHLYDFRDITDELPLPGG
ncbi:MAG TPA: hypothetical protein VID94_01705 [Acidimicrobiales bacterium]